MKKKIFFGIMLTAIITINSLYFYKTDSREYSLANLMQNAKADACEPNVPDARCPIWSVKLSIGTSTYIECTTGGTYICELQL